MKRALVFAFALGCGPAAKPVTVSAPPQASATSATSATAPPPSSAPSASPDPPQTPPKFEVVKETMHADPSLAPMLAHLGDMIAATKKLAPIEPKVGALSGDAASAACFVAAGLDDGGEDSTCAAKIDAVSGGTLTATVDVAFESDTMQSRAKTHATLHGTIALHPTTHAIAGASFRGTERFEHRPPCEKNDGCDHCDPLVRRAGCAAKCFCPFKPAGTAEVETRYTR